MKKLVNMRKLDPHCDIEQIATLEALLEDKDSIEQRMNIPNKHSSDLQQEGNPHGHYDKICWYERVSHCDLEMGDEQQPPP